MKNTENAARATPSEILKAAQVPFTSFGHAPIRTLADIERELALPPEKLLKTMAFRVADARMVLAALPILSRVHYGRLARAVGVARSQLRPAGEEDLRELGMEPGGISPLTRRSATSVVFDEAVADMGVVYCGSGRADETIKIEARDLVSVAGADYAAIAH